MNILKNLSKEDIDEISQKCKLNLRKDSLIIKIPKRKNYHL